jgi:hypothetical protein
VSRPYMRTSAEAHMYMDQQPCTCGDVGFDRQSAVMIDGNVLCSRYFGKCRTCGATREFIFELPPTQRPIPNEVEFGGSDASRLLDPGEWMAISDYYAKLEPGTPHSLDIARAAFEEVIKFLPDGAYGIPDKAFWTERGRAVRDREPGRFRRARLLTVHDDYRRLLGDLPPPGAEALKRAFDAHFGSTALYGIYTMTLPAYALRRTSGEFEGTGGWDVKYRFVTEDGVQCLECFLSHRMTNDRICRVYADGRVEIIAGSADGMAPDADLDSAFYADARRRGF